jgi:hypothetical protein
MSGAVPVTRAALCAGRCLRLWRGMEPMHADSAAALARSTTAALMVLFARGDRGARLLTARLLPRALGMRPACWATRRRPRTWRRRR